MAASTRTRLALLLVFLMLAQSAGMASSASNSQSEESTNSAMDPILVEGLPPLMCSESVICPTPARNPVIPQGASTHETPGWWFSYGPDLDWNGMDDRLQYVLAGVYPSQSPEAIVGSDGELTVAIIVDFAWHPRNSDVTAVRAILEDHGWVGEEGGARIFTVGEIDSVIVDRVPQSALLDLYHLEGVVVIEQQNVMEPAMSVASKAVKARLSQEYTSAAHMMGFTGDGVVIAILDSGVDNEHRSLNDFDDVNDDPDSDADSYDDKKWVAGFDSTDSFNSQTTDGSVDPDDTAGHGTHVAGIALGTGDSSREHVGIAPGAYLVDVKVFTDVGRSNTQYTISGINWTINNVNTDWGNNASSRGIDIISMSFGRARSPVGDDTGDNGTSAEARMVNDAWDAGIVPVCAMGNDGANYVAAPASADRCIAVAASDDRDTVTRADDIVADYSNYGPRQDDGDSDSWDELKPDVIAPGTSIYSAQHAASGPIGGGTVLADDSYVSQSGTSMSTPVVSGIAALILQSNPDFGPSEVKSALQNYSEVAATELTSTSGPSWNESEGFGRVDAVMVLSETEGGGEDPTYWVNPHSPVDGTWLSAGDTYRFRGNASIPDAEKTSENNTIESVRLSGTYGGLFDDHHRTAFSWVNATGVDNWTFDLTPELWWDGGVLTIEFRGVDNNGRWSEAAVETYRLGENVMTLEEPTGYGSVSGEVEISGTFKVVEGDRIEYRIGDQGEWQTAKEVTGSSYPYVCDRTFQLDEENCDPHPWSVSWNSTEVEDGGLVIAARMVRENGWISPAIERYVVVDNIPMSPDLHPQGDIVVEEHGMVIQSAYANSYLNLKFDVRNSGDAHARQFDVMLLENGNQVATTSVPGLDSTKTTTVSLGYHPTTTGTHNLEVVIDSTGSVSESDEDDNRMSIQFSIDERPPGIDLVMGPGSATTTPEVPNPNSDLTVVVRVENIGSGTSSSASFSLEMWTDIGWEVLDSGRSLNLITSGGYVDVPFSLYAGSFETGEVKFRAKVTLNGENDIDESNNELEFTVAVDETQIQGARKLELSDGHALLGFYGVDGDNLLFTGEGSSIWMHRVSSNYDLITCLELEDDWAGEFSLTQGEGDSGHIVWTRRYTDDFGVTQSTLTFGTVDLSCTNPFQFDLMPSLMLAEGHYWGLDINFDSGRALVAGYHRNLFTNGTYGDETSIFILASETPNEEDSWNQTLGVIENIDPVDRTEGMLSVAWGEEWVHLMYQAMRSDSTNVERVGTFYAHGRLGQSNWSFDLAIGDDTSLGDFVVIEGSEGEDILVGAWREGEGVDAELVLFTSGSTTSDKMFVRTTAPGLETLQFIESEDRIQLFHDSVGPNSRQIVYSMVDGKTPVMGTPISDGAFVMAGRSESAGETHLFYLSPSGDWRARMLVDDREPVISDRGILDDLRLWTGLDERTFDLAFNLISAGAVLGCLLLLGAVLGIASRRRRLNTPLKVEIDVDDDDEEEDDDPIELMDEEGEDVETTSEEFDTEPPEQEVEEEISRRRRRKARTTSEPVIEIEEMESLPPPPSPADLDVDLPPPPTPGEIGVLPPPPKLDVTCDCGAKFKLKTPDLTQVKCPVCKTRIDLGE